MAIIVAAEALSRRGPAVRWCVTVPGIEPATGAPPQSDIGPCGAALEESHSRRTGRSRRCPRHPMNGRRKLRRKARRDGLKLMVRKRGFHPVSVGEYR